MDKVKEQEMKQEFRVEYIRVANTQKKTFPGVSQGIFCQISRVSQAIFFKYLGFVRSIKNISQNSNNF